MQCISTASHLRQKQLPTVETHRVVWSNSPPCKRRSLTLMAEIRAACTHFVCSVWNTRRNMFLDVEVQKLSRHVGMRKGGRHWPSLKVDAACSDLVRLHQSYVPISAPAGVSFCVQIRDPPCVVVRSSSYYPCAARRSCSPAHAPHLVLQPTLFLHAILSLTLRVRTLRHTLDMLCYSCSEGIAAFFWFLSDSPSGPLVPPCTTTNGCLRLRLLLVLRIPVQCTCTQYCPRILQCGG